jgi:hypothetical protein
MMTRIRMPIPGPAELKFGTCHSYNLKFMPTSISAVTFKLILPYAVTVLSARRHSRQPEAPAGLAAQALNRRGLPGRRLST